MMPVTDAEDYERPVSMGAIQSTMSKAEQRKSNKPIMEKRRRARINHCLNELKTLILNAMKKDPARHSKLEKADILEMTVKHLQNVQRGQLTAATVQTDPAVITRFRSGFDECAAEVTRYMGRLDGVDTGVKQRLSAHLNRCVNSLQQIAPPSYPLNDDNNNSNNQRVQLVPNRLLSGEMALVMPNSSGYCSSAFKPPHSPKAFQPFQVDLPNSHLKAHISIPEGFHEQAAVQLKPNPNLKIYPKLSPQKVVARCSLPSNEAMEPPVKMRRQDSPQPLNYSAGRNSPPQWEPRISVIVRDQSKNESTSATTTAREVSATNRDTPPAAAAGVVRDMWRPW